MKSSNMIALIGVALTAYALWRGSAARGGAQPVSKGLRRARTWGAAGVDPFGASYTVEKTAQAGGLDT
jgi:hypothetical protein